MHAAAQEAPPVANASIFRNGTHLYLQDDISLVASLKPCAQQKDLYRGRKIHAEILKRVLLVKNVSVGNNLVNMYAKCGLLAKAQLVFDELLFRDVVSWTALIAGYAQYGLHKEALNCFEKMQNDGPSPNAVTYSCILKACGNIGAVEKGREIHTDVVTKGLLTNHIALGGALVDMYSKCGALAKAQQVFDELPIHNVVTWTALIAGYCEHEHGEQALTCLKHMKSEGLSPNAVTLACILKACGSTGAVDTGMKTHADIVKRGFLEQDSVLGNVLVDMYVKCGALEKAQKVFDDLVVWDIVSWNVLVTGYTQFGHGEQALCCFERMICEGFSPNEVTFALALKACGSIGAGEKGKEIHAEISRQGLLRNPNGLGNALIDMYVKCGIFAKARQVFDELSDRDVVSWNVLIAGCCQHKQGEEALECYECMKREGLSPDTVTFICTLKACGSLGAAEKGKELHVEIVRKGLLGNDIVLGNALVDMYAKCGALVKAQEVFDELQTRNLISWTALIAGYSEHGHGEEALICFEQMRHEGISPDAVTFACVLKACSTIEAFEKGQMYYESMSESYGIIPTLEHYTCIVDLFGCAGHFDKAVTTIKKTPFPNYLPSWFSLLSACQKRGNVKLGGFAFEHARRLKLQD